MFGKALSLVVVTALVAAGAGQASTLSRVWFGKTARGGEVNFLRAGNRMHDFSLRFSVPCTNEVEGTNRDEQEEIRFDQILKLGRGGRIHTTQRSTTSVEKWTLTLDGTLGATKGRGRVAWTYEKTSSAGYFCHGKGSSRWTAKRGRPVADQF